jgi:peptidoglycan DL-endopeptidase RipA
MALYVTPGPRTATRVAGTLLAVGLLAGLTAAPAAAAPGDSAIAEARQRADALTERMGALAEEIETAQARADAARAAAAIALDTFQATQEQARAAQSRAAEASAASAAAREALGEARDDVVGFARQSYMDGSSYPGAAALVTAADPAELVERAALLEAAGGHRSDVLVEVTALQQQAQRSEHRATVALDEARTLEEEAESALQQASAAEASARQQAQEVAARRTRLEAELATAKAELAGLVGAREATERARRQQAQARPEPVAPPAAPPRAPSKAPSAPVQDDDRPTSDPGSSSAAATAIAAAKQHLGLSYAWGGGGSWGPGWGWGIDDGVWGFDCSGLTQYAYAQAGIDIPRNSRAQYAALPKVRSDDLRPGDLVFWATSPGNPQTIHHVAIYLGGEQILEAPQSGDVVKISPMRWYHYAGAVRPSA